MKIKNYVYLCILLLISAINFNICFKPYKLVCGGTIGLAIILHKYINISYSMIVFIINILMLFLSIILINKKMAFGTLIAIFLYPFFIKITSNINFSLEYFFLNILIGAFISGFSLAFIYKLGFSTGGINTLSLIIKKYLNLSIGTINFILNLIILILNLLIFGIKSFFNSVIVILINALVINYILYKKI